MDDRIRIELAQPEDAAAIAEVHYAAVHQIARSFYPEEVINDWSCPVNPDRIERIKGAIENPDEWMIVARQGQFKVEVHHLLKTACSIRSVT